MTWSTFILLCQSLPDLIKLIRALEKAAAEAKTQRKVADDVKTIHEAFESKDPTKLNALFASQ